MGDLETGLISIASAYCLYVEGLWQDLIFNTYNFQGVANWVSESEFSGKVQS